MMIIHLG